jgi:hypothetical protein
MQRVAETVEGRARLVGNRADIRHWLFQANPARYRIHDFLKREGEERWNLHQHAADIQVGDLIAIWVSGDEAGVYALGA